MKNEREYGSELMVDLLKTLSGEDDNHVSTRALKLDMKIGSNKLNGLMHGVNRPIGQYLQIASCLLEWQSMKVDPGVILEILKVAMEKKGSIVIALYDGNTKQVGKWEVLVESI